MTTKDPAKDGSETVLIYRIAQREEVASALESGEYRCSDLDREGFIHCSYAHQILRVANARFCGCRDLVLLKIDRGRLVGEVLDENLDGGEELFPHIYRALPMEAVIDILEFPCELDGTFMFPESN